MENVDNIPERIGQLCHLIEFPEDRHLFPHFNRGPVSRYKRVLELDFNQLPVNVQRELRGRSGFGFDQTLSLRNIYSDFFSDIDAPLNVLVDRLYMIVQHEHSVREHGYSGDLSEYVVERNLRLYKWIVDQKFDLSGVDDIYINTSM